MKQQIVSRWDAGKVLFECELPEGIESGMAMRQALEKAVAAGANLSGANLSGADLQPFKTDFFDVLLRAPRELAGLREALVTGRVDGSVYRGKCACLVGTIANVRHVYYTALGNGLEPDYSRPIERFFMSIREGDTPETNQVSKLAVEWLDEFQGLLTAAGVPA